MAHHDVTMRQAAIACLACAVSGACAVYALYQLNLTSKKNKIPEIRDSVVGLIGNTPLVKIQSLSQASGCTILGKCELLNPAGSAKDRIALAILETAEERGLIRPNCGDVVFEGTSGSTGISLAMLCRAKGYECHIVIPDDTSQEKVDLLTALGAVVHMVRPASIVDPKHYVNYAKTQAELINDDPKDPRRAIFADQFENLSNWQAHYDHTGPEIFSQTDGRIDAFVTGAGTGGTISGVSKFLKEQSQVLSVLADPEGSGLYNKVNFGVMFDLREKEGTRRRHQVDTLVEGIGINRLTQNFAAGLEYIDKAIRVTDAQALVMAKYLSEEDGLFVGSSSAINCVAAYKVAQNLGPGHIIVTILCDSGSRHLSKFWRHAALVENPTLSAL